MKDIRKVHREANLTAYAWAGDISTSEYAEAETQSFANKILPSKHGLKLRFSQLFIRRIGTEDFSTKRERRTKVVLQ